MRRVVFLAALVCAALSAQPVDSIKPPLKAVIFAEYSDQARLARLQGSVMLSATIGVDGKARDIRVVKSLGLGLDENAVEAAARWQFTPRPVPVELMLLVDFHLKNGAGWSLAGAQFTVPEGASQPQIVKAPYTPADLPLNATVHVAFDVDPQGVPANIRVEESSDPKCDDEVIAMIREWRFQAAVRNGFAVEAHAVFDLTRGLQPLLVNAAPTAPPRKKQ